MVPSSCSASSAPSGPCREDGYSKAPSLTVVFYSDFLILPVWRCYTCNPIAKLAMNNLDVACFSFVMYFVILQISSDKRRRDMSELLASTVSAPSADDAFTYWTYKDLLARRIVSSRTDLHRKQRFFGFPKPVILTAGQGANALYRVSDVKEWLLRREKLAASNAAPKLKSGSRPRGRPRKHPTPGIRQQTDAR